MSRAAVRPASATGLLLGLLLGLLAGCGRGGPEAGAREGAPETPVGRWKLDREALLAALAAAHADAGPAVVAREQDNARQINIEMELAANGLYRMATLALGFEQRRAGTWRQEGPRLLFTPVKVDGKTVEETVVEEARYKDGRIEIDFDGKVFPLVRQ